MLNLETTATNQATKMTGAIPEHRRRPFTFFYVLSTHTYLIFKYSATSGLPATDDESSDEETDEGTMESGTTGSGTGKLNRVANDLFFCSPS